MNLKNASERSSRPTIYPSAIDAWIVVMLLLAPMTSLAIGLYLLQQGQSSGAITLILCAAAAGSLSAAATVPCRYTLHNDALTIRCGLLCYQIPFAEILSVSKSATILSGPALSMKRVLIKTSNRNHILSPNQRDVFIDDLEQSLKKVERITSEEE